MLFTYRALKKDKLMTGKLDVANEAEALAYLKSNNYFPIELRKAEGSLGAFSSYFNKVTFTDIVDFTRQLAIMLNAGLTLVDCFDILKKQLTKASMVKMVTDIDRQIRGGKSFSSAIQKYPEHFPSLYISLVKSGEISGKLSDILLKLAENLEKQREFKGKIRGALVYPLIVMIGMVLVMFVMITFVVPKLLDLYKDFDIELPLTTRILIVVSSFSAKFWPLIGIGTVGLVTLSQRYLATKSGKYVKDKLMMKMPIINNVIRMSALVDATRTLSILIASGVSILDALDIIVETSENIVFQNAFASIYKQVEKGVSLGQSMSNEGIFPPILVQMTTVGEQTGHLDETLGRISTYFQMESELAVKAMTTLIEPLILVFLGIGVGFLVMSVITPIYNLTSSFK
ncbi:MAG: type II secretion system F family protein [bacterium]|nr:type II secretion system F family protein [bacterium]